LVPIGTPGELFIGGEGVARGYLGRPDLTAERFVPDELGLSRAGRLYRTGDVVRYRSDGSLEFLGRVDHQVKVRGHRVELGEIEAALCHDERVQEAVVVSGDHGRLVGFVVAVPAVSPDERASLDIELRRRLAATLPDVMVPASVVLLDRLPRTANGKIDRKSLSAMAPAPLRDVRQLVPPRSDLEHQIVGIYRDVLGLSDLSVGDNFFDLGGDSLLAVQVHRRLRETVAVPVSLTDLFRFPTVRAMAEHVGGVGRDSGRGSGHSRASMRRELTRRRHVG
jgi:hypothetical protein